MANFWENVQGMPDQLVGELNRHKNVMDNSINDPFKIASDFTSFYEDESGEYYNPESNTYTSYLDFVNKPTVGQGITGNIGEEKIVAGQEYPANIVNQEFGNRMKIDWDRLNESLQGGELGDMSNLSSNQQAALLSLVHNVGYDTFRFKEEDGERVETNAFKALKSGDFDTFMTEAFDPSKGFVKAGGEVLSGLQRRRAAERDLFTTV